MNDKPVIDPNPKKLPDILASLPAGTPIVMLNLLRFIPTWRSARSVVWAVKWCGRARPWPG